MQPMTASHPSSRPLWPRLDALLLALLLIARLRIDTLAEAVAVPLHMNDVARNPLLGHLLSDQAMKLLAQQGLVDPIGMLLIVAALGCLVLYLLLAEIRWSELVSYRVKLALIWAILLLTVFAPSIKMMLLRQGSGPASYSHDGGVIQTEATIDFLLSGRNPYVEDYTKTPMAEWGLDLHTALYHFPYLPWTLYFSLPFFQAGMALFGWFDERVVYLLLFVIMLLMAARMGASRGTRLALVMVLGLNPIMGSDVIFGQNDSFVLFWLVAALWAASRNGTRLRGLSPVFFALACDSKPTAWFLGPFFLLYWAREGLPSFSPGQLARRLAPFLLVFAVIVIPFVLWDPYNFYDDVWAWSAGTSPTAYQIRGWGLSNFVLGLNLVPSRVAYFPFWIPEAIIAVPLVLILLRRQWRENTLANIAWHGAVLFFAYAYASRFLNENYLGFIVGLLAVGVLMGERIRGPAPDP